MPDSRFEQAELDAMLRAEAGRGLTSEQVEILSPFGALRHLAAGDMLFEAGKADYGFSVLLSGKLSIFGFFGDEMQVISTLEPTAFVGELGLLSGQRPFLSCRVEEDAEVLHLSAEALHNVINQIPEIGDVVVAGFAARREVLMKTAEAQLTILGPEANREVTRAREFVSRNRIPHRFLDTADEGHEMAERLGLETSELNVVLRGKEVVRRPDNPGIAYALGMALDVTDGLQVDLAVIG
ncbi:MAG: cyclic nucleotide-binding domain-containing protein, partial [Pseudomonadota bacterium]